MSEKPTLKQILPQLQSWCAVNNVSVQSVYDQCHGMSLQELVYYLFGAVKQASEEVVDYEDQFKELYNYVHDYFDNLDVQNEINNKLNDMVNDGTLESMIQPILTSYQSPIVVGNLENMVDHTKLYLYTVDEKIYYWNGEKFVNSGISYGTVSNFLKGGFPSVSNINITAPYDNLNTVPINSMLLYTTIPENCPITSTGFFIITFSYQDETNLCGQLLISFNNELWHRNFWSQSFTEWKKVLDDDENIGNFLKGGHPAISNSNIAPPYDDLNTVPVNSMLLYTTTPKNAPVTTTGFYLITFSYQGDTDLCAQILITYDNIMWHRNYWSSSFTEWRKVFSSNNNDIALLNGLTPYQLTDINNAKTGCVYLINATTENTPIKDITGGTLINIGYDNDSKISNNIFFDNYGNMFTRSYWGDKFTGWINNDVFEIPILSMFSRIGVVGDSYASGEIYNDLGEPTDFYELSWLKQLSKKYGFTAVNFSKGGLNTRTWLTDNMGYALLASEDACDLYILALGINDSSLPDYIGTPEDVAGTDTFYGNYKTIINEIKTKSSKAKMIFLNTYNPSGNANMKNINDAIKNLSEQFNIPLVDQNSLKGLLNYTFYRQLYNSGHPNAVMYSILANVLDKGISRAIRESIDYFKYYPYE